MLLLSKKNVARIGLQPGLLDMLQLHGLAILKQIEEVAEKLNTFLSDENQKSMLAAFSEVSEAADKIATIPYQLQPALAQLLELTRNANSMVVSLNRLSDDSYNADRQSQSSLDAPQCAGRTDRQHSQRGRQRRLGGFRG